MRASFRQRVRTLLDRRVVRDESGASMVEFAIVATLLLTLVFGLIDFGDIYSQKISLRQGVREGARLGVVGNFTATGSSCTLNSPTGGISSDIQALMCETKNRIGASTSYVKVMVDGSYAVNNGLIVCAMVPAQSLTGFFSSLFSSSSYIKTKVEMNIESVSGSSEGFGSETPSSGDWSWCTASSYTA